MRELLLEWQPLARVRWSMPENLHVTTKFIGEWPAERLDELKARLQFAHEAVPVKVRDLGFYPNERAPRVFWAGVEAGPELASLAKTTDEALAAIGVAKEERVYSPHLTLARISRPGEARELKKAVAKMKSRDFGEFEAREFFLYESRNSMYTRIARFELG